MLDWKNDVQSATSMFYDSGRIYFTRSGSGQLYYRYFTPESNVVGAKRLMASDNVAGIDFSPGARHVRRPATKLYWAKPDGSLNRIDWADGNQSDVPVGGAATQVSGPADRHQRVDLARAVPVPERQRHSRGAAAGGGLHRELHQPGL